MKETFQYDVFLSHNQADKLRVRRLAERLRAAGLRVWFDEWVIQPGHDIYLAIERGLEASRTLVLCLSPEALGSGWVTLERSTVLFRDPSNASRRFIPLRLADASSTAAPWNACLTRRSSKIWLRKPGGPKRVCHRTKQPLLLFETNCQRHVIPRR